MSSILNASASGGLVTAGDASATLELQSDGTTKFTVAPTGAYGTLLSGAVTAMSGSSVNISGIPTWAKRVTLLLSAVSTSGASALQVKLGTTSGLESTGYTNATSELLAGVTSSFNITNAISIENNTGNLSAAATRRGALVLYNYSGNEWVYTSSIGSSTNGLSFITNGGKTLAGALSQLTLTTINGTDTFDATGTIKIVCEG